MAWRLIIKKKTRESEQVWRGHFNTKMSANPFGSWHIDINNSFPQNETIFVKLQCIQQLSYKNV